MDAPSATTPPPAPGAPPAAPAGGSAAARAYAHVKERLLDGRFPGGSLLSENEVSQRLGLSRTPVRQAFVQLEAAIAEQEEAVAEGTTGFAKADRRFHRAIVHAAGNAILTRLYDALLAVAQRIVTEHRGIVEALGRGDAAQAADLVSAHLRAARDVARGVRDT